MPSFQLREHVIEGLKVLNELTMDLTVGARAIEIFDRVVPVEKAPRVAHGLFRMVIGHLAIALHKFLEFNGDYLSIVPEDMRSEQRRIIAELNRRGVRSFRTRVVAHYKDRRLGRPLNHEEINRAFAQLLDGDEDSFLEWISSSDREDTVAAYIDRLKARLIECYNLEDSELFPTDTSASS